MVHCPWHLSICHEYDTDGHKFHTEEFTCSTNIPKPCNFGQQFPKNEFYKLWPLSAGFLSKQNKHTNNNDSFQSSKVAAKGLAQSAMI